MKQVLLINGGESYNSYDAYLQDLRNQPIDYEKLKPRKFWHQWVAEQLTEYDVLLPRFPNSQNAVYNEWKIYFEKLIPFFGDDVQIIGHSLGAMFLAKYLHENPLQSPVRRLLLVSGGYDDETNEDLGSFRVDSATGLEKSTREVHLFHSADDPVVPFTELAKFQADLPEATTHTFDDRGHFIDETFPEILNILQAD